MADPQDPALALGTRLEAAGAADTGRPVLVALAALVLVQLAIGLLAARRIRTEDDYLLAGRRLGPVLASASIFATWFGAESCIGAAGSAYAEGITAHTTEPFAYGLCLILMGLLFAARLWRQRVTTLADFFAARFGSTTERVAALLLLPSSLLWAAAQIRAFGHIVAANSGGMLDPATATWIAAAVAIVYTVAGGLLADVYTDLLQGMLLLVGLGALGLAVLAHPAAGDAPIAGASTAVAAARVVASPWSIAESWAVPICGSIVAQEALSRTMAARSATVARNSAMVGGAVYVLAGLIPLAIGVVGPRLVPNLEDPETILPHAAQTLLPWGLNLLFAGALVAAILSTVDSCLLVTSSIVTRNLLPRGLAATGPTRLAIARLAAVAAGVIALALACTDWNVKDLVTEASGFGSAGVFVLAVVGCYGRFGRAGAANACLAAGLATWVVGRYLAPDHVEHPYLWSLVAAGGGFVVGSLLDRRSGRG